MDKGQIVELSEDEQEFLHQMFVEEDNFDEWADNMDKAIENGEISPEEASPVEIEFDIDDFI